MPKRRPAPRFDLIPTSGLVRLAARYALGAETYGAGAWKRGLDECDALNHGVAHILAYRDRFDRFLAGERPDPRLEDDDLSAVAWCAFTLMHYQDEKKKTST
jgi:hypothetical protein